MKWRRITAWAAALALTLSLAPGSALAAEEYVRIRLDESVSGAEVYSLLGDEFTKERLPVGVPEGGVTALIFFQTGCGNCQNLFRGLLGSEWLDDPRVNIVAVSHNSREDTRNFVDRYWNGRTENVYYVGLNDSPMWSCVRLIYGTEYMNVGTAFVVLLTGGEGEEAIRWHAQRVSDAGLVNGKIRGLLGSGRPVQAVKTFERAAGGQLSFGARLTGGETAVSGTLYAAAYTGGRMTGLERRPLSVPAGGSESVDFTVRGETAKLFFLEEGTCRPLTEALEAGA